MSGAEGPGSAAAAFGVLGLAVASLRGIRHFRCFDRAALMSLRRLMRNAAAMRAVTVTPAAGTSTVLADEAVAGAGTGAGGGAGRAAGPRRLVISTTSAKITVP